MWQLMKASKCMICLLLCCINQSEQHLHKCALCIFISCDNVWCTQSNYKQNLTFFSSSFRRGINVSNSEVCTEQRSQYKIKLSLICVYFNFFQGILGETSDLCTYRTQTLHDHQSEKTRFKMGVPSQNLLNTQRYKPWSVVPHVERSAQFEGTAFPTICMWFPHLD